MLVVAALLSGCVPFISNRTFMVPLAPLPAAQLAPHDWMTVWAGAQVSPVHEVRASDTAVQVPSWQPELGAMFLTGKGYLLVGGALHASWSEWARPSAIGQADIKDRLLFGGRIRLGVRAPFTPRFGLIVGLEPGIDWLPFATRTPGVGTFNDMIPSPALSGSVTPYFENDRLRAYVGVMAWTMSAAPVVGMGDELNAAVFTTNVGLAGGVKINLADSLAVSATVTVPVTRSDPPLLPMFSLALHWHLKRPVPQPASEPSPAPPPAPSQL